ncbi:MAG TPA: electron transport complex subunit RsxC [Thermotogaceae bacterium]|nr:electron transport complex subunit RsxC [Thermotogaceae bacterium]
MKLLTFKGGVHPPEKKELSKDSPLENFKIPEKVYLYLVQSAGAPPKLLVEKGQEVKTGQKIAETSSIISSNLHSPITGVVEDITKMFHPILGAPSDLLIIKRTDEKDEWDLLDSIDFEKADSKNLVERIKEAGIVGLGGAAFPTHVKLSPPKEIDTLIINGAECEPYLTVDHRLMLERTEDLITGIRIIMKILKVKRAIIGVETNKRDAIDTLNRFAGNGIEIAPLKTKYPQGAEKQLIKAILNREVPSGGLPMDVKVVVQNVGTAIAIKEAVVDGKPLIERGLTITGEGVKTPKNIVARIGTPIEELIEFAGGYNGTVEKVILGGPMMGIAVPNTSIPTMKGTSGIVVLTREVTGSLYTRNCIRCGRCIEACPMNLRPNVLYKLVKMKRYDDAVNEGLLDCIECGSCAYICPSKIDHVRHLKLGKKVYRALRRGK